MTREELDNGTITVDAEALRKLVQVARDAQKALSSIHCTILADALGKALEPYPCDDKPTG